MLRRNSNTTKLPVIGSVRTFAHLLGKNKAAELLQTTLDEESETNEILNKLAESIVNREALRETELAGAGSNC